MDRVPCNRAHQRFELLNLAHNCLIGLALIDLRQNYGGQGQCPNEMSAARSQPPLVGTSQIKGTKVSRIRATQDANETQSTFENRPKNLITNSPFASEAARSDRPYVYGNLNYVRILRHHIAVAHRTKRTADTIPSVDPEESLDGDADGVRNPETPQARMRPNIAYSLSRLMSSNSSMTR